MGLAINQRVEPTKCLVCGSPWHRAIFYELGVEILQCRQCHHVFSSFAANPHYDGFWGDEVRDADLFYWNNARARMHRDFFRKFLVGRSGRLLDMGCGLGFFLKAIVPYASWESYGCEISPVAVRYARDKLGLANIICGPPEKADLPQSSFDIITLWDVVEHLLRPDPLLRHCNKLLREGGICFIRTPNLLIRLLRVRLKKMLSGKHSEVAYLQARDHLHYYSMSSIRRLLERNGFVRVQFTHLHPIQSVPRNESRPVSEVKNACFEVARVLAIASRGHVNFDNLFVVAHKESQLQRGSGGLWNPTPRNPSKARDVTPP